MRAWSPRSRALALVVGLHEPPTVTWDAPPSCPDATAAAAEILGRIPEGVAPDPLHVHARVRPEDGGSWRVDVELRGDVMQGTRTLHAQTCAEALTATAVVVAIAIDPERAEDEPAPSSPEEPIVPTPPEVVADDRPPPDDVIAAPAEEPPPRAERSAAIDSAGNDSAPASPRRLEGWSIGVRGGLGLGALPSPSAHLAGRLGLFGRRWHVLAGAVHRFETQAEGPADLGAVAGGRFRLTGGRLGAGPRLAWGRFELPLDAGVEVGAIWARGTGAVEPRTTRRLWVAAVASGGVAWAPIPALAIELGVDGVVPLTRPTFTLGESVELLTVGLGAIRAWLGISGRFSL